MHHSGVELFEEGTVKFLAEDKQTRSAEVFFNPSRRFDRDTNVILLKAIGARGLDGIDAFAGSGVRGLRLCAETEAFGSMLLNDIKTGITIKKNISLNKGIKPKIKTSESNAIDLFCEADSYDYVDIDPFGSPVAYAIYAMPRVRYGGMLAVTATDTAALYGKAAGACRLKYGARSFKTSYHNELGLRILLKRMEEIANIHSRSIKPLFFDVRKHYVRAYMKITKPDAGSKIGFVYDCISCPYRSVKRTEKCPVCGSKLVDLGPAWLGELFDRSLVRKMEDVAEDEKMKNYLSIMASEEDTVSYYTTTELASYLKQKEKSILFFGNRTVLNGKGFRTDEDLGQLLEKLKST